MRIIILLLVSTSLATAQSIDTFVNPFVGTDAHGHTFPGATTPFGMVQLSPDTRVEGWDACGGYHYSDSSIIGFSHTHLSGTGVPDYGDILFKPMSRRPSLLPARYRSSFSHADEAASAGYYRVRLTDDDIEAELTATTRTGIHRYRFPRQDSSYVIIDLKHGLGPDVVIHSFLQRNGTTEITGFRRSNGWARDQHLYFVAHFSLPILAVAAAQNDTIVWGRDSSSGTNTKAALLFDTRMNNELTVKVALSSVSIDGARKDMQQEAAGWDFDRFRTQAAAAWNEALSAIDIRGGTEQQRRTFYTALYHTMIAPNTFSDTDGRYRGMNGSIRTAKGRSHYTVFSLWDTFRALHPLLSIIDEKRTVEFVNTFLAQYDEGGLLPVWELCANETYCMIGYHSVSVIADAVTKGFTGFDRKKALAAMVASAEKDHFGLSFYRTHGYVPGEKESESVSKTLEYAYDDWCIARTAEAVGDPKTAQRFAKRSQNYRNVFDPSAGFMRGKRNGMWNAPFSPAAVSLDFTEANSWQYSFFVPHDIPGMMQLYGGREAFVRKLDELFSTSSALEGRQQSDITGLIGQYAHGNEPSHHMAYLYTYAGAPAKTQQRVRQILDELYSDRPDGLSGNEDCGQMSAWYVMSAMGLYQVAPGSPEYTLTTPLFDTVIVRTASGRPFTIITQRTSAGDRYIGSAARNGKAMTKLFVSHKDITAGSTVVINAQPEPGERYNTAAMPVSRSAVPFTAVPFFSAPSPSFRDSLQVAIHATEPGVTIHYTTDGRTPTASSPKYTGPITLRTSATIRAVARRNNVLSAPADASFIRSSAVGTVTLRTPFNEQYTAGGKDALVDGITGVEDFRVGHWQGYYQDDLDATVDLGSVRPIQSVRARFLQDNNAWIFFPTSVKIEVSQNGGSYQTVFEGELGVAPQQEGAMIKAAEASFYGYYRYVRVTAKNIGLCPPWHKGAGGKAWLFIDEIEVK
ncbi:MAG: glycoside hydrolase family 92 protein [Bacteroidetes bacterium]|nr:glycoside hydrolase family 92 protein [Bacteroidota bacterium]